MVGEQFFEWLENSWDFEKLWEKIIAEKNKDADIQYNINYQQFKIMSINRLDELIQGDVLFQPNIGGINIDPEDRMKST